MTVQPFNGSLHSHGCWTDYRNPRETKKFPFNLELFACLCMSTGRDFQAITDIMARYHTGRQFSEHRYSALLDTANPKAHYSLQRGVRESAISSHNSGRCFYIPRSQEVLTDVRFKHILAVGADRDILGGRTAQDILKEIKDSGGYVVIDHTFMCNAWTEDEVLDFHSKNLVDALEWNGGLTFPPWLLRNKTPNRSSNNRVLALAGRIPVLANDDSHCERDIRRGAFTTYFISHNPQSPFVDSLFEAVKQKNFCRTEQYSPFLSPVRHILWANDSRKSFGQDGLPGA